MLNTKEFTFQAESKHLEATIKKAGSVLSVSGSESGGNNFFMVSHKKKLQVVGLNNEALVIITVPDANVSGDGAFGFATETILGLIKGRAAMNFEFNLHELSFKQLKGKYTGKLVTLPISSDQQSSSEAMLNSGSKTDSVLTLPNDLLAQLKAGVQLTSVKDVFQGTSLLSYISLKDGMLTVASLDNHHFGRFCLPVDPKIKDFRVCLPSSHFGIINNIAAEEDAKFYISTGKIRVEGKTFSIVLPATQSKEEHFFMVDKLISTLTKPAFQGKCSTEDLLKVVDNLFTLFSANTSMLLESTKDNKAIKIGFNSNSGSASDTIAIESKSAKAFKANVEPRLMKDITTLAAQSSKLATFRLFDNVVTLYTKSGDAELVYGSSRVGNNGN